jgi:hypothetical protein
LRWRVPRVCAAAFGAKSRGRRLPTARALVRVVVAGALLALSPAAALASTPVSHMISGAQQLTVGSAGGTESGGGANIDFWEVQLNGGDQLVIDLKNSAVSGTAYRFELYAAGTTDRTFASAPPSDALTNAGTIPDQLTLQGRSEVRERARFRRRARPGPQHVRSPSHHRPAAATRSPAPMAATAPTQRVAAPRRP